VIKDDFIDDSFHYEWSLPLLSSYSVAIGDQRMEEFAKLTFSSTSILCWKRCQKLTAYVQSFFLATAVAAAIFYCYQILSKMKLSY
jgi:hypothetical protein